jgi:hypothetical protein
MNSKKYSLLFGLLLLVVACSFAQESTSSYDVRDSSLIPSKRIPQHNEFLNNAYPFPAKPRNEIEIGVKGGWTSASTDVRDWGPTGGFGFHVRKALGYVFSLRAEYDWMRDKGLNWQPSVLSIENVPQLNIYYPAGTPFFYNYKTTIHEASLQGVVTLNNIRFHRAKTGFAIYMFAGVGGMTYSTFYNALDGTGTPYNFSSIISQFGINGFTYSNRKAIKKAIKGELDGTFETMAQRDPSQPTFGGAPFKPVAVFGAGIQFKLTEKKLTYLMVSSGRKQNLLLKPGITILIISFPLV